MTGAPPVGYRLDREHVAVAGGACRSCAAPFGFVVLDLGDQPACDEFPACDHPAPEATYPLRMWLCSSCGLAQLVGEPTVAAEPRGVEPEALVAQAADAVDRLAETGWLTGRRRVTEFPSPHGGSWLPLLGRHGVAPVSDGGPADLVIDSFGMMHDPDQALALEERAAHVAPDGVLALQYHSLGTIVRLGQWNALRHGHFAYYSTSALVGMLQSIGFVPRAAWRFDLYGGTVLLAASRGVGAPDVPGGSVDALLSEEGRLGVRDPVIVGRLQQDAETHVRGLREWLLRRHEAGERVVGYGAASRAVALLCRAGVDRRLLPAVVDTSPAKHGRRMPGTDIPIVGPQELAGYASLSVLLFVPDLLAEVRKSYPEVEDSGGRWVDAESLRG